VPSKLQEGGEEGDVEEVERGEVDAELLGGGAALLIGGELVRDDLRPNFIVNGEAGEPASFPTDEDFLSLAIQLAFSLTLSLRALSGVEFKSRMVGAEDCLMTPSGCRPATRGDSVAFGDTLALSLPLLL